MMNLFERIFVQSKVNEETAKDIMINICISINAYVKQNSKFHDSLRIDSFLIDQDNKVSLLDENKSCKFLRRAPESIVDTDPVYDDKSVSFELGIILFEMVTSAIPFQFADSKDWWYSKLSNPDKKKLFWLAHNPNNKHKLSNELIDLIECLLAKDPANRPSYHDIMEHPWFA